MSNTNTEVLTTAYEKLQGAITQSDTVLSNLQEAIENADLSNYATTSDLEEKANKSDIGSPLIANTIAEMTDTSKVYVYVGSETGYTNGNWYSYNGTVWVSGGVYNSIAVSTDKTLTSADQAADSKTVGDKINSIISAGFTATSGETYESIAPSSTNAGQYVAGTAVGSAVATGTDANKTFIQLNTVTAGEKYRIYCSYYKDSNDIGYIFAHVESGQNIIDEMYFDENATTQKTGYVIATVPEGATRLFVNGRNITPTIEKVTSGEGSLSLKSYTKNETYNKNEVYSKTEITDMLTDKKVPVIAFDFDETALDNRYKILSEYGFSATFSEPATKDDLKTLVKNGFDICPYLGSHTLDYSLDTTKDTLVNQINTKMQQLESWGVFNPIMVHCSGHRWGTALETALKETGYYNKFHYIRANVIGETNDNITDYTSDKCLPSDLLQFAYTIENRDLTAMKNTINSWIDDGEHKLIILMSHKLVEDGGSYLTKADFTELVSFIKSLVNQGKVKCMNMREYYEYYYPEQGKKDDRVRIMSAITSI